MRRLLFAVLAALSIFIAVTSPAQDLRGARPMGMGQAYRAIGAGNSAIYYNPAAIMAVPRYSPELQLLYNPELNLWDIDLSVVDSLTNQQLGMGLGYTFTNREPGQELIRGHRATAALAYPMVPKIFYVGAGFKYLNIESALNSTLVNALTADLGMVLTPGLGLAFALVGYNVIPITTTEAPMSMAAAAAWSMAGFSLAADWTLDFETKWPPAMAYHLGAEYYLFEILPLRVGYINDQIRDTSAITFGLGFSYAFFGIDVGYQQQLEDFNQRAISVGLKFFVFNAPSPSATPGSFNGIGGSASTMPQTTSLDSLSSF